MANTRDLKARLRFDGKQFRTGMQQMQRDVGKMNKSILNMSNIMRGAGVVAGATVGIQMVKDFNKMIIAADQLNKKTKVVFGEYEEDVNSIARSTANGLGLSRDQFREASVSIADLLVPMGFARKEAVDMSIEVVKLSGALSEWSNGQYTAAEAANVVKKAMLGETEQMKNLGIKIDQTSKQFNEQVQTTMRSRNATLEQAKAIEILNQIQSKSVDAQTAFANNQDSIARKSAAASAAMNDMKDAMVRGLLPSYQEAILGGSEFAKGMSEILGQKDSSGLLFIEQTMDGLADATKLWINHMSLGLPALGKLVGLFADEVEKADERLDQSAIMKMLGMTGGPGLMTPEANDPFLLPSSPKIPTSHLGTNIDSQEFMFGSTPQEVHNFTEVLEDFRKTFAVTKDDFELGADAFMETSEEIADVWSKTVEGFVMGQAEWASAMAQFNGDLAQNLRTFVKLMAQQSLAGLLGKIFKDQKLGPFATLAIAAGASAIVNGLFSGLGSGGGTGGGGGGAGVTRNIDRTLGERQGTALSLTISGDDLKIVRDRNNRRRSRIG